MKIDSFQLIERPSDSLETMGKDEIYIMTTDLEQNESKEIETFAGGTVKLYTPQKYNANYRTALPKVGKVVKAFGKDCKFKEGQEVICTHFTFVNERRVSTHFAEIDGVKYYRVANLDILAGVEDGKLVPQDEVIICKPIVDKLIKTTLELSDSLVDIRRDVAEIYIVPDKYKDILKPGEYLFLNEGADYLFDFNGETLTAVELFLDGALMYGPELDYTPAVLWRHKNDHNKETDVLH